MSAECSSGAIPPGYKQTEVGVIPEDWEIKKLGKTANLKARIGWQGLTTNEYLDSGDYYLVTGTEFVAGYIDWDNCHYVSDSRYKQDKNIQLKEHDILVTKDGTIGKVALINQLNKPATLNSGIFVIRPIDDAFHPEFFYFLLCSNIFNEFLSQLSAGSTISHLYQKDFVNFLYTTPPTFAEQESIAKTLSDTDALIESLEQLIAKKRQIKQGAMQELLTGKRRLPGFEIKQGYKQTEVGVIPEDWESSKIGDYAFVTKLAGFEYTLHFDYSKSGPIIAIRALNIKDGTLKLDDVHTIPKETSDALPRSKLKKDDLVISYVGTLGRVAVIPEDEIFHLAPNVAKLSVNRETISPSFLSHFLNSYQGQKNIFDAAASTTQAALSMSNLREIFFARPPLKEQEDIATVLSDIDSEITTLEEKLTKARRLKQGIMQDLLTGRIRLI